MKANSLIHAFAGTYSLQNLTKTVNGVPNPNPDYHWGSGADGIIVYTASGYMSACLATTDPSLFPVNVTSPPREGQPDAEWAKAGKHTLGYAGPFSFDESFPSDKNSGQLLHGPLTVATIRPMVGTILARNYTMYYSKGKIEFMKFTLMGNNGLVSELWWKRVD